MGSYIHFFKRTWVVGVIILFTVGYVLPGGQMFFWGATENTNLTSAVPYMYRKIYCWMTTMKIICRQCNFNRILYPPLPTAFIVAASTLIHLLFLHKTRFTNSLGTNWNIDIIPFHSYFTFKDIMEFNHLSLCL